ncbi:MAG TPA: SDR family NAD(P)-dependent oxidoreductase [Rectinemataceae bacterium]|nr:SDR family NAD(P)-dependent oxidoreductase [Rectinemataceae bacterium]
MYAVVTGASSGLGAEFARNLASRHYDLCLAARRESKLGQLKAQLERDHGIRVDTFSVDLSTEQGMRALHEFTSDKDVDILVNDAGIFVTGMPDRIDLAGEMAMLDINVKAMHYLTRLFLRDMIARDKGRILNVASVAGWLFIPTWAAYSAGKAYMVHLTAALAHELRLMKSRARVAVVTPGYLNTEIAGPHLRMVEQNRSIPKYIDSVVTKFLKGNDVIVLGRDRLLALSSRLAPRNLVMQIALRSVTKTFIPR